MKAIVVEDAPVLLPVKATKNFSHSRTAGKTDIIPKNSEVEGQIKVISGLRQGKPFEYKLFFVSQVNGAPTERGQIIFLNKIKPMNTEVQLGADSARTGTVVDLPSTSNLGFKPVLCTLAGAGAGFYYAKKKSKHKPTWVIIGGVIGFIAGKYWQDQSKIVIKPSK